jgi:hypothetical protein
MYVIKTTHLTLFRETLHNSAKIIIIIINKTYFTGKITLRVAQTVNREQL